MSFLRNAWYVAAWDQEVKADTLLSRTLLNESVLLFRDDAGTIQATSNRCPHRFAPLHTGKRVANGVQCPYHGLEFNGQGRCMHNPHADGTIPKAATLRTYPVHEKYSAIWIWMGDVTKADASLIPDFSCMDRAHWYVGQRYLYARANYVLETDNIMDLSHIQYLHPTTLGSGSVQEGTTSVEQFGETVWSKRFITNEILPDFLYDAINMPRGTPVDRWLDVRWDAPANMWLQIDIGKSGQLRENAIKAPSAHLFTPETNTTTHYWFSMSYPKTLGPIGEQLAEAAVTGIEKPFQYEDLPMLEAQQKAIGDSDFWSLKPVLLPSDASAIRARRVLDALIHKEEEATVGHSFKTSIRD